MATVISKRDDLDGAEGADEFHFSVGPKRYQIDLSEKNREAFERAIAKFIEKATLKEATGDGEMTKIRKWAKENGLKVNDKGRVSKDVVERYEAAHGNSNGSS